MSKKLNASFETTLHVYDHCLCFAAQRAARALARRFDEALSPLGLTSGQFSLLTSLNQPEPPSMGSIAALLVMDRTTLTANLKPLEQRGWVEIAVDEADRRVRRLILTPAGRAVLQSAMPVWVEVHGEIDRLLPVADGRTLRRGLRALA
ncbi:MarR family transcriptional regulator [Reyranella sp.]|jgi:DNA-binding MarR family transcriptional regulator|uniref:MarR family winged helix-turn-helix transcriptional regulator n=1 Tax=Reyranella sp. TaxID=1929291 RepID=UPI000BC940D5|nr:MarR family transcriptional regulator [Reyranella sp.]OYY45095.1 MAG: MarR family transcriptional regulator [Rhodospirillales bacterium 35-66-84]OYZ95561.1 MAG: MarR family transcriptional regulator [Rhodospirillales bacterium 24-66-33]OZB27079.1 MAG: MarR family transcriptional regulator [Rhodospirillales bacterium 39-66-50]HQS16927.1 MarR family transcriptional regulator [Reyranella sp.]HQT12588.1 MarR family transcriptional regulator [Reyranella sp.]